MYVIITTTTTTIVYYDHFNPFVYFNPIVYYQPTIMKSTNFYVINPSVRNQPISYEIKALICYQLSVIINSSICYQNTCWRNPQVAHCFLNFIQKKGISRQGILENTDSFNCLAGQTCTYARQKEIIIS